MSIVAGGNPSGSRLPIVIESLLETSASPVTVSV